LCNVCSVHTRCLSVTLSSICPFFAFVTDTYNVFSTFSHHIRPHIVLTQCYNYFLSPIKKTMFMQTGLFGHFVQATTKIKL